MSIGFKGGNCIEKTIQFSRQVHTHTQREGNITCIFFSLSSLSLLFSSSLSIVVWLELSNSVSFGVLESKRVDDNGRTVP